MVKFWDKVRDNIEKFWFNIRKNWVDFWRQILIINTAKGETSVSYYPDQNHLLVWTGRPEFVPENMISQVLLASMYLAVDPSDTAASIKYGMVAYLRSQIALGKVQGFKFDESKMKQSIAEDESNAPADALTS